MKKLIVILLMACSCSPVISTRTCTQEAQTLAQKKKERKDAKKVFIITALAFGGLYFIANGEKE